MWPEPRPLSSPYVTICDHQLPIYGICEEPILQLLLAAGLR